MVTKCGLGGTLMLCGQQVDPTVMTLGNAKLCPGYYAEAAAPEQVGLGGVLIWTTGSLTQHGNVKLDDLCRVGGGAPRLCGFMAMFSI